MRVVPLTFDPRQEILRERIAEFQMYVAQDPTYHSSWNDLGLLYLVDGRTSVAKECFLKAINYCPAYPDYWLNLGVIYFRRRDFQQALALFQKVLALNPRDT